MKIFLQSRCFAKNTFVLTESNIKWIQIGNKNITMDRNGFGRVCFDQNLRSCEYQMDTNSKKNITMDTNGFRCVCFDQNLRSCEERFWNILCLFWSKSEILKKKRFWNILYLFWSKSDFLWKKGFGTSCVCFDQNLISCEKRFWNILRLFWSKSDFLWKKVLKHLVFVLIKIWYLVKCWEREMGSFKG